MKRTPRPDLTSAEAARVGEELREARLTLGASVEDMADRLRINRRYIHALEEGRVRDLPGPAYAVGFVRSYAGALGLDADEAVRRFRDVTGGAAVKSGDLVFPEPVPSRGVPAGALVAVGAVLAVGAYVAWYNWSGSGNRVVDAVPPLPPRLEESLPEAQTAPAGPPSISLRARGDSWVRVRDTRQNQTLYDRVMRSGDVYQVPAQDGLVLTTGKAENLDILINGEVASALHGAVGVRRGISLDGEQLAAGGTVPATEASPAPQ